MMPKDKKRISAAAHMMAAQATLLRDARIEELHFLIQGAITKIVTVWDISIILYAARRHPRNI